MVRQGVDTHDPRVREIRDIIESRQRRNVGPGADIHENLVSVQQLVAHPYLVWRFKTRMALEDRAVVEAFQPALQTLV